MAKDIYSDLAQRFIQTSTPSPVEPLRTEQAGRKALEGLEKTIAEPLIKEQLTEKFIAPRQLERRKEIIRETAKVGEEIGREFAVTPRRLTLLSLLGTPEEKAIVTEYEELSKKEAPSIEDTDRRDELRKQLINPEFTTGLSELKAMELAGARQAGRVSQQMLRLGLDQAKLAKLSEDMRIKNADLLRKTIESDVESLWGGINRKGLSDLLSPYNLGINSALRELYARTKNEKTGQFDDVEAKTWLNGITAYATDTLQKDQNIANETRVMLSRFENIQETRDNFIKQAQVWSWQKIGEYLNKKDKKGRYVNREKMSFLRNNIGNKELRTNDDIRVALKIILNDYVNDMETISKKSTLSKTVARRFLSDINGAMKYNGSRSFRRGLEYVKARNKSHLGTTVNVMNELVGTTFGKMVEKNFDPVDKKLDMEDVIDNIRDRYFTRNTDDIHKNIMLRFNLGGTREIKDIVARARGVASRFWWPETNVEWQPDL
jgi:hypothetical protein